MTARRGPLPTGTVTFLRSDIEGSMGLTRRLGTRFDELNERHQAIVRDAVATHGGRVVRTEGDAFFVVFDQAPAAVRAAAEIQRLMTAEPWPEDACLRVRIGLHAGSAHRAGDDYGGFEVNRAARVAATGWGGQIVLSDAVRALAADGLPSDWAIRDLGLHRLKDVPDPERLYQLDVPGLRHEFPPLRGGADGAIHLPTRLTSFVGRDGELQTLGRLLGEVRLLTLTGPGGSGKTSLALELARRHGSGFADGTWFVPLQTVRDPAEVRGAIARSIGLYDGSAAPAAERLAGYLAERTALLVVDNFEQVLDAAPDLVELLVAAPGVRIVVTSRAPLRVAGEQEYPVRPLDLDHPVAGDAEPEAVRLFSDRARSARPALEIGGPERALVRAICALVDGLPLGIELAAARASALPLAVIRDRLAAGLPLPGSGPRDLPDRQRTLERTIAWSHDLLEPSVQRLFARCSVFEGSFDLEQATAVAGPADELGLDVLDGLMALTDQSLLKPTDERSGEARFRSLDTIRAFALERLRATGEEREVCERHARAYLDLAERAKAHLPGRDQVAWLDRLAVDAPNLRAALVWAIEAGEVEIAMRLAAASWRFWLFTGRLHDGRHLMERVLAMPGADEPTAARLVALDAAGGLAYWGAQGPRAEELYEAQLALARHVGDRRAEALAQYNLAHARFVAGETDLGEGAAAEAERLYRELGDEDGLARVAWARTTQVMDRTGPEAAEREFRAILRRFEDAGDEWYAGIAEGGISWTRMRVGDVRGAAYWGLRSLIRAGRLRTVADATISLPAGALLLLELGRPEGSALLLGAYRAASERYGLQPPVGLDRLMFETRPDVRSRELLGVERYDEAFARGERMSLDEAVEYGLGIAAELGIDPTGPEPQ